MAKVENLGNKNIGAVYDISLDGTFVDAFTGLVMHNTDGFNFQLPPDESYRYTKDKPYIGKGSNREVKLNKEYIGYEADVAEFNDLYMNKVYSPVGVQKMGLGIDEIVDATINFSRKNYADYFPNKPFPKDVKMVGNTIKSKKMPEYIAKFLSKGIRLLLQGNGQAFISEYYNHIENIYNYRIPLRDIASKGKVKKTIEEYLKDVSELTKAGRPKSRQAWYELAIKEGIKIDNGDTIYYINTGKAKSHSDIKKVTRYYEYRDTQDIFGEKREKAEITKEVERAYKKALKESTTKDIDKLTYIKEAFPNAIKEEEIIFNCMMLPNDIIEKEEDTFCGDGIEYNTSKYIDMFNKRIKPLLVCFDRKIRENILITNPDERQYFTEEECKLVSGQPNKPSDEDTYEQLMTMEDKELKFWTTYDLIPPFIEDCGMGTWDEIKNNYFKRLAEEKENGIADERDKFRETIENMSKEEYESFIEEGELPLGISKIIEIDPLSNNLVSKRYPDVVIGTISDIAECKWGQKYKMETPD